MNNQNDKIHGLDIDVAAVVAASKDEITEAEMENGKDEERNEYKNQVPEHPQQLIQVGDWKAEVDRDIAPLIKEIWTAGICTYNSCQENQPGIIWIEFATVDGGERFLNIVTRYRASMKSLYNRASNRWSPLDESTIPPFWSYAVFPHDRALDEEYDDNGDVTKVNHPGRPSFAFSLSIRFPQCDYATVLHRLQLYNARKRKRRALRTGCFLVEPQHGLEAPQ